MIEIETKTLGTLVVTEEDISYEDAVKKGKLLTASQVGMLIDEGEIQKLNFWFWLKNPRSNKRFWRPVACGYNDYFSLDAGSSQGASRGVYIKKVK